MTYTSQWWSIKATARCEMTIWVEAETSQQAKEMYENYDYEETSAWKPISSGRVGRPKPAPHFVPTRDNP